jgi:predicted  nucleic acid-binding Zn-ribbon protein
VQRSILKALLGPALAITSGMVTMIKRIAREQDMETEVIDDAKYRTHQGRQQAYQAARRLEDQAEDLERRAEESKKQAKVQSERFDRDAKELRSQANEIKRRAREAEKETDTTIEGAGGGDKERRPVRAAG